VLLSIPRVRLDKRLGFIDDSFHATSVGLGAFHVHPGAVRAVAKNRCRTTSSPPFRTSAVRECSAVRTSLPSFRLGLMVQGPYALFLLLLWERRED